MSRVLAASRPGFFGSGAILRLFAAGGGMGSIEESPGRAAEEPATVYAGNVRASPRVSFADRDHGAERVDTTAGGEFVDDRIRLRE